MFRRPLVHDNINNSRVIGVESNTSVGRLENQESGIRNPESGIRNPEYGIRNSEFQNFFFETIIKITVNNKLIIKLIISIN